MKSIGKTELAQALGWTRARLDRIIDRDKQFPVLARADRGWKFDLAAVQEHLGAPAATSESKSPAIDTAQLRDAVAPPLPAPEKHTPRAAAHRGEATARQRKDNADAALREDKLRQQRDQLIEVSEARQILAEVFAGLGNDLDCLPEQIVKQCNLPAERAEPIRTAIDNARIEMVARARNLLTDDASVAGALVQLGLSAVNISSEERRSIS